MRQYLKALFNGTYVGPRSPYNLSRTAPEFLASLFASLVPTIHLCHARNMHNARIRLALSSKGIPCLYSILSDFCDENWAWPHCLLIQRHYEVARSENRKVVNECDWVGPSAREERAVGTICPMLILWLPRLCNCPRCAICEPWLL